MSLSDERLRGLYAHARDEEEKQRLLAAFHLEPPREPLGAIFELGAGYLLTGAAGAAITFAVNALAKAVLPDSLTQGPYYVLAVLLIFLGSLLAINASFDGKRGARRKEWLERVARTYAFPITLLVGLYGGWAYHGYTDRISDEGRAKAAALAACSQIAVSDEEFERLLEDIYSKGQ